MAVIELVVMYVFADNPVKFDGFILPAFFFAPACTAEDAFFAAK